MSNLVKMRWIDAFNAVSTPRFSPIMWTRRSTQPDDRLWDVAGSLRGTFTN